MEAISELNIDLGKLNSHDGSVPAEEVNNNLSAEMGEQNYWSGKNVESKWNCAL